MQMLIKNIGSSFYKLDSSDSEYDALKKHKVQITLNFTFYYSGRNALLAVLKDISIGKSINKIWLPSYYCDTVVNLVNNNFDEVDYYPINPFDFSEELNILSFANKNDVVILNNFWGLSSFKYSKHYDDKPTIIEDHSHGWLSKECINSNADYCISSLRKTYPIPLGAVAWKPNFFEGKLPYKNIEDENIVNAYNDYLKSMIKKREYLKSKEGRSTTYLELVNSAEELLNISKNYVKPNNELINQMQEYIVYNPNPIKEDNLNYVLNNINPSDKFKIIHREGYTPFGLLLLFGNKIIFNSFKNWLISNNIYPAHLWPNTNSDSEWKYLLNIHIDFRYNIEDMEYLVEKINYWCKNDV